METIKLRDEYIKLGQALKAAGFVESGVDAKYAIEDGLVYVKLLGACLGCSSSGDTITNSVEALLLEEVPGVIGVEVVEEVE